MPHESHLLTVVVSGRPVSVAVNPHQEVSEVIRKALRVAGHPHADPEDWTLRAQDGRTLPREARLDSLCLGDDVTLFLDPDEGGGGSTPVLADPAVTAAKLERQLLDWHVNAETYRQRGWLLLERDRLCVLIGFLCRLPIGPAPPGLAVMALCVRFDFTNYDLEPPSLRFLDPVTRQPAQPCLGALDFRPADGGGIENSLIAPHPHTDEPFLCKRGVREYHTHPEHSGDDWLLYRDSGLGTLASLCTTLWRLTTRTVIGLTIDAQEFSGPVSARGFGIGLRQADVDQVYAGLDQQAATQQAAIALASGAAATPAPVRTGDPAP